MTVTFLLNIFILLRYYSQLNGFDRRLSYLYHFAHILKLYHYIVHSHCTPYSHSSLFLDDPPASAMCTSNRCYRSTRRPGCRLEMAPQGPSHSGWPQGAASSSSKWVGHRYPGCPCSALQLQSLSGSILVQSAR